MPYTSPTSPNCVFKRLDNAQPGSQFYVEVSEVFMPELNAVADLWGVTVADILQTAVDMFRRYPKLRDDNGRHDKVITQKFEEIHLVITTPGRCFCRECRRICKTVSLPISIAGMKWLEHYAVEWGSCADHIAEKLLLACSLRLGSWPHTYVADAVEKIIKKRRLNGH